MDTKTSLSSTETARENEKTVTDLLDLAKRCEAADGPNFQLEFDIARAVKSACHPPKNYTASVDAALTLMPGLDWEWSLEWETNSDGGMFARCALGDPMRYRDCEAPTLPLAICAAALKARALPPIEARRVETGTGSMQSTKAG
jgi:hypothetical protein